MDGGGDDAMTTRRSSSNTQSSTPDESARGIQGVLDRHFARSLSLWATRHAIEAMFVRQQVKDALPILANRFGPDSVWFRWLQYGSEHFST
jgi:hypothetical protein